MNNRVVQSISDFISATIRVIDKFPIIPVDNFFIHKKSIYQINDKLERYLEAHRRTLLIDSPAATVTVAKAETAITDQAQEENFQTHNKNDKNDHVVYNNVFTHSNQKNKFIT